jgi:hypothetical protein
MWITDLKTQARAIRNSQAPEIPVENLWKDPEFSTGEARKDQLGDRSEKFSPDLSTGCE